MGERCGSSCDRRGFLLRAAALIPLMHQGGNCHGQTPPASLQPRPQSMEAITPRSPNGPAPGESRFARLRLRSSRIDELAAFYRQNLELSVEHTAGGVNGGGIEIACGQSIIEFSPAAEGAHPYYHFAFNIPHNTLDTAVIWMQNRCPLVRRADDSVIFHFESWNAHAIYFIDPAGNIVEFIARHTLSSVPGYVATPTWFDASHMLCVSEIGVVTPDVAAAAAQLRLGLGLETYHGRSPEFHAVGDELGLFIVVKTGRRWFSSDRAAEVFPAEAVVRNSEAPAKSLPAKSLRGSLDFEREQFRVVTA